MIRFLTFILVLASLTSLGQRKKYSEVFELINSSSDETAIMMTKEFLISEPEHPNANFHLQRLYAKRYKESDILTEFETGMANAEQTNLRSLKCSLILSEKEVRRNDEYYLDLNGQPATWEYVNTEVRNNNDSSKIYMEMVPPIYESFTKSVANYDKAIKIYADLCSQFNSFDNLLMFFSEDTDRELLQLKEAYDSTLYHFNAYKSLIAEYPINYDQSLEIQAIDRFRLQGLVVSINFLQPQIKLWDYGKWVDEVRETLDTEISTLRNRLKTHDKDISSLIDRASDSKDEIQVKLDKELLYTIEKYDFQSLPVSLLNYKEFLVKYKWDEARKTYYDTANLEAASKFIYYAQMINSARRADTLLTVVKERNIEEKRRKHSQFFSSNYGGTDGLNDFIASQESESAGKFDFFVGELRRTLLESLNETPDDSVMVKYQKSDYPLFIYPADSITSPARSITHKVSSSVGNEYLGGWQAEEERKSAILYKSDGSTISWFKNFDTDTSQTSLSAIELTRQGITAVVRQAAADSTFSTFYLIDETGKVAMEQSLATEKVARKILYDEEANRYTLVFRGSEEVQGERGETTILAMNSVGDVLWKEDHSFVGRFEELIPTQKGYLLTASFSDYVNKNSSRIFNDGEINALVLRLSERGLLITDHSLISDGGISSLKVVKVSDSNINLLGNKGGESSESINPNDLIHVIIDSYGRVIYSNIE